MRALEMNLLEDEQLHICSDSQMFTVRSDDDAQEQKSASKRKEPLLFDREFELKRAVTT